MEKCRGQRRQPALRRRGGGRHAGRLPRLHDEEGEGQGDKSRQEGRAAHEQGLQGAGHKGRLLLHQGKHAEAGKLYPRIKFRRNISQTAHAVQGETIAENFGIFEFGSNPDWRWLYVALSRASSLKQAWFYDGEPLLKRKELGVRIREKLASYKEQDEKAGRATDKFITEKWVMERFKTQNYCCAEQECMRPLLLEWDETDEEERGQQFSVDRTNNEFGHVLGNCRP